MKNVDDTLTDRGQHYGDFERTFGVIQQIKATLKDGAGWAEMPAERREALEMIAVNEFYNRENDMNDQQIESEIQAKGLTAPRVTPQDIEANIASEHYFTAAAGVEWWLRFGDPKDGDSAEYPDSLRLLTFCVLVLKNGYTVTGESACASPENFDAELGRKIARQNAVNKIWPLMGYALKQRLHDSM